MNPESHTRLAGALSIAMDLVFCISAHVGYQRPPLWSSGQSSWLQIQRSRFDSRCYQIFREVVGLEPWAIVQTIHRSTPWTTNYPSINTLNYKRSIVQHLELQTIHRSTPWITNYPSLKTLNYKLSIVQHLELQTIHRSTPWTSSYPSFSTLNYCTNNPSFTTLNYRLSIVQHLELLYKQSIVQHLELQAIHRSTPWTMDSLYAFKFSWHSPHSNIRSTIVKLFLKLAVLRGVD
jgi:hypothetical protein